MNAVTEDTRLQGDLTLDTEESFGRSRRRKAPATASRQDVSGRCANRSSAPTRDEIEADTLRVFAGSDFGDAAVGRVEQHVRPPGAGRDLATHARRSILPAQIVERTLRAVGAVMRRMLAKWRHQRQARETYLALRGLDDRILRDLGFDRSEIGSIAAEVARDTDYSRARSERALRGFY